MNQQALDSLKKQVITGRIVDLHPFSPEFAADIARLRNQEKARYFLSQNFELTPENQLEWMLQYADHPDQINFVAVSKSGAVVGTFGLYNYQNGSMEFGRLVFDLEKVKGGVPYALESAILVFDLAFDYLGLDRVVANIREDNHKLLKFACSLGFYQRGSCLLREQPYVLLAMESDSRPYLRYGAYINAWMDKLALRA